MAAPKSRRYMTLRPRRQRLLTGRPLARPVRIAIVGTGAIGFEVARAAAAMEGVTGIVLYDIDSKASARVAREVRSARVVDSRLASR